jgi:30S ribosomal protein S31
MLNTSHLSLRYLASNLGLRKRGWVEGVPSLCHTATYSPNVENTTLTCLVSSQSKEDEVMGKGDKRTKRGKIKRGTYGKTRPRKTKSDQASSR